MPPVPEDRSARCPRTEAEERLLNALKTRLVQDGRSVRRIEQEVGLGHGTLANVLRGRSELRFHHLERLAPALGFTIPEIVAEAYGDTPERMALRSLVGQAVRKELEVLRKDRG